MSTSQGHTKIEKISLFYGTFDMLEIKFSLKYVHISQFSYFNELF